MSKKHPIQLSDHFTYSRLFRFVLPSIVMMVFTSIYGVVDGLFVSNFAGKTAFASINLIMPFLIILGAMGFMLGTGGTALVSRVLGEGDKACANKYFSMITLFGILLGVILTVVGVLAMRPMAILLGATEAMVDDCVLYGRIVVCFLTSFMLQNMFQSFLIAAEQPKFGLLITLAAGVTNMVLDALFVGVFRWGIAGAAIATGISQTVGGVVPLMYFLFSKSSPLRLRWTKFEVQPLLRSCANGSSELMSNISGSLIGMLYNAQLMRFLGEDGVATYGVLMYVQFIFVAIDIGYSIGCAPIISYHYGARNHPELRNLLTKGLKVMGILGIVMTIAAILLSGTLANIFVGYDAARLPPLLLRLPACGLQHLPVLLLHGAEQRRRVRSNFLPAHAGVSGGVGYPAADGAGCGRSLVGSLCGGSAGVRRVDWLPAGHEGEIPLF